MSAYLWEIRQHKLSDRNRLPSKDLVSQGHIAATFAVRLEDGHKPMKLFNNLGRKYEAFQSGVWKVIRKSCFQSWYHSDASRLLLLKTQGTGSLSVLALFSLVLLSSLQNDASAIVVGCFCGAHSGCRAGVLLPPTNSSHADTVL